MSSGVKLQKKKGLYSKISEKTVFAHEFWDDNQYFGSYRPRTALQWHRACYFLWSTILAWGQNSRLGAAPECLPVSPGLLNLNPGFLNHLKTNR